MKIKTIIEKQRHGYLIMFHDGTVLSAVNQVAAKALVDAESRRLAGVDGAVINEIHWRGTKRLVKGVK